MSIFVQNIGGSHVLILNFSCTPSNQKNNAILGIICSFEYNINSQSQAKPTLDYTLDVYKPEVGYILGSELGIFYVENTNDDWELASLEFTAERTGILIHPNLNEYPIKLIIMTNINQASIRNVNLMLLVIDG